MIAFFFIFQFNTFPLISTFIWSDGGGGGTDLSSVTTESWRGMDIMLCMCIARNCRQRYREEMKNRKKKPNHISYELSWVLIDIYISRHAEFYFPTFFRLLYSIFFPSRCCLKLSIQISRGREKERERKWKKNNIQYTHNKLFNCWYECNSKFSFIWTLCQRRK